MDKKYYFELVRQQPINYNGLLFYPISLDEISEKIGYDNFDNVLYPFLMHKDCIDLPEEDLERMDLFEDFILANEALLYSVVIILRLFCKCDDIRMSEDAKSIVLWFSEESFFEVTKDNFDDICSIIMQINAKQKIKVEKPPKNMSEKQKDIWLKLQEGRRKDSEKNGIKFYDILNICEFGGEYHIPQSVIGSWTLWKINHCFSTRVDIKNYTDGVTLVSATHDGKPISGDNYWIQKMRVRS